MEPFDIQRGIRPARRSEVVSGPNLGRVARVREPSSPASVQPHREGRKSRGRIRLMLISAAAGLAALVVIVASFTLWLRTRTRSATAGKPAEVEWNNVRVASKFPSPGREQAVDLVRRAVMTRDPRAVAELYRDGAARSAEIIDFLKGVEMTDGPVEHYEWLSSLDTNGLLVEGVAVIFRGGEKPAERIAFLTPDTAGIWQMDFDAFARTVTPSWQELLQDGADGGRVRIVAGRDVYYNGPFSDESQWTCYALVSPDTEEILKGYSRVGTPEDEEMKKFFPRGEATCRATLELRRVKDAGPRQFEISRVVAKDWILPLP